jgi:hypothetical protein
MAKDEKDQVDQAAAEIKNKAPESPPRLVEELAAESGLPAWKLAGIMRAQRWAPGKAVTAAAFDTAAASFNNRPVGGGRRG